MAKPVGGLLSFDARGQVAKTIVFSSWRGRGYVRRYVTPANPQTAEQQLTRDTFSWLSQVWKRAPTLFQAPWQAYAQGQPLTDRNAFNKFNVGVLRSKADLVDMVFSPAAKGGLPPVSAVCTPGSTQLSIAVTTPTPPSGWTLAAAVGAAIRDQDPQSGLLYDITAAEDTTSTYAVVLTGLTASVLYQWGVWLRWTKPDGSTAYSIALRGDDTPTA